MAVIAWQGWRLSLPEGWNPLRLEGDYGRGQALFVDLERPQIGLRWEKQRRKRFDAKRVVDRAMTEEVGQLAAAEARPFKLPGAEWEASKLYIEPDPPGRDVWIGYNRTSQRLLQVVYHCQKRDKALAEMILPDVQDMDPDKAMPWAI